MISSCCRDLDSSALVLKLRSPLPDFYIGAHAALRRYRLLTRDRGRYTNYFPTVEVIAPE